MRNTKSIAHTDREEQWLRILHRITGAGMFIFLALHILHVWLMGLGPEPFNSVAAIFNHPLARLLHVFLFFSVLFHAINGARLIILDTWPALWQYKRRSVNIATLIFLLTFIPSALLIFMDAFLP